MNSSIRKPKLKAVKHHEIDLQKNDNNNSLSYNSIRKALSTQKERVMLSNKLTSNVPSRQIGMHSNQKSREKIVQKKPLINSHTKPQGKRPITSITKRKSLANKNTELEASRTYLNEDVKKLNNRSMLQSAHSPDIVRRKANLIKNDSIIGENYGLNPGNKAYESTNKLIDRNVLNHPNDFGQSEETPSSITPHASHLYNRSTITP